MFELGEAGALPCGTVGRYGAHLKPIVNAIGLAEEVNKLTSMNALVLHSGTRCITDTYVQEQPGLEDIAKIAALCSMGVRRFGMEP